MTSLSTNALATMNPQLLRQTEALQEAGWPCIAQVFQIVLVALILGPSLFALANTRLETWI